MKIDTLNFLTVLLTQHSPAVLHPHIGVIIPAVVTAVDDNFYKITSEALLVLNLVVKTIRPLSECEGVCVCGQCKEKRVWRCGGRLVRCGWRGGGGVYVEWECEGKTL